MEKAPAFHGLIKSITGSQGTCKGIDVKDYEKAFNDIDVDGDGCLTIEELKKLFEAQGQDYTEDELRQMVAGVDKNFNGTIELEEFLELITVSRPDNGVDKEEMLSAFQIFDRKRRGYVSIPTLKFILTKVGPTPLTDNVNELLRFADIKGDGKVYYEEVVRKVYDTGSDTK